jgi:hypothetical protein
MKALLNLKIYWLILAIIICYLPSFGQDCTAKELKNAFDQAKEMISLGRNDTICKIIPADQLEIRSHGQIRMVPSGSTYLATYYYDQKNKILILEIVVVSGSKGDIYKTYVFINGEDFKKIVSELRDDYYRIRVSEGKIIFNFYRKSGEAKAFALYDLGSKTFCYSE